MCLSNFRGIWWWFKLPIWQLKISRNLVIRQMYYPILKWASRCGIIPSMDFTDKLHINGLVQERCNSIANALKLRLSCTYPLIFRPSDSIFCVARKIVVKLYIFLYFSQKEGWIFLDYLMINCLIFQNSGCAQNEVPDDKTLVGFAQLTINDSPEGTPDE